MGIAGHRYPCPGQLGLGDLPGARSKQGHHLTIDLAADEHRAHDDVRFAAGALEPDQQRVKYTPEGGRIAAIRRTSASQAMTMVSAPDHLPRSSTSSGATGRRPPCGRIGVGLDDQPRDRGGPRRDLAGHQRRAGIGRRRSGWSWRRPPTRGVRGAYRLRVAEADGATFAVTIFRGRCATTVRRRLRRVLRGQGHLVRTATSLRARGLQGRLGRVRRGGQ